MAETPVTIKLGGQVFIRTTDMAVLTLSSPTFANDTTTLHEADGTNYQVPTGKIFRALEITIITGGLGTGDLANVRASVNADTADGTIVVLVTGPSGIQNNFNISIDFAADTFVTKESVSSQVSYLLITGIEMDA